MLANRKRAVLLLAISGSAAALLTNGGPPRTPTPTPTPTPAPAPTPTPAPAPAPTPTPSGSRIGGTNLATAAYWSGERDFMNLVMGDQWRRAVNGIILGYLDPSRIDPVSGAVRSLAPNESASLMLTPPAGVSNRLPIRCTWQGQGTMSAGGSVAEVVSGPSQMDFKYTSNRPTTSLAWVSVTTTNPANPLRALDCRETSAPRSTVFAPEFLNMLRPFGVLRFMDWQNTNANLGGRWNERTSPTSITHGRKEGVAIEHLVALSRELNADPWLHVPYNADPDYIRRYAQLVHDTLPADRKVYVELSNEVWNYGFPVATQAQTEGLAMGLSPVPFRALLYRYTQKARAAHAIWAQVFADRPGKLVRVLGSQSANPWVAEQMMAYQGTGPAIDALATAPYFSYDPTLIPPATDPAQKLNLIMLALGENVNFTLTRDAGNTAIARQYGKRHIAYEAGQHVKLPNDLPLLRTIQTDPRMYNLYRTYAQRWYQANRDLMMFFNSTSAISIYGAWGMREYAGQPIGQTPKRQAINEIANYYR